MFGMLHFSPTVDIMELEKSDVWRYTELRLNSVDMIFGGQVMKMQSVLINVPQDLGWTRKKMIRKGRV